VTKCRRKTVSKGIYGEETTKPLPKKRESALGQERVVDTRLSSLFISSVSKRYERTKRRKGGSMGRSGKGG